MDLSLSAQASADAEVILCSVATRMSPGREPGSLHFPTVFPDVCIFYRGAVDHCS